MRTLMDMILGRTRLTVQPYERLVVMNDGRFSSILGPGEHCVRARGLVTEAHDLRNLVFASAYAEAMERDAPALFAEHFTVVEAAEDALVTVTLRNRLVALLKAPGERRVLFTEAGPFKVETHALDETLALPRPLVARARTGALAGHIVKATVEDGRTGLLFVEGDLKGRLGPGVHYFAEVGRKVDVKVIDLRVREMEAAGQEVLTADKVTLRVNLVAEYRVADPVKAATAVADFAEALRLSVQLAYRRALGAKTLDAILSEKGIVDEEATGRVKAEMAAIGIEVTQLSLKDVILPGEMRELLNQVVAAEKAAEANVIRRREETNATRALLNTAKVMAENPVMLRLKELEALTEIAGKVERLTVHNGTEGLMTDLVKLRD